MWTLYGSRHQNERQAHHGRHDDPAVAHDLRVDRVRQSALFYSSRPRGTPILEHAAQQFAEEGACADDPEADPDAPDVSAQNRDDPVPKELQHRRCTTKRTPMGISQPNLVLQAAVQDGLHIVGWGEEDDEC